MSGEVEDTNEEIELQERGAVGGDDETGGLTEDTDFFDLIHPYQVSTPVVDDSYASELDLSDLDISLEKIRQKDFNRSAGTRKRLITKLKKDVIESLTGVKVTKKGGVISKNLIENLEIELDDEGHSSGIKYKGARIFVRSERGEMKENDVQDSDVEEKIAEFRANLRLAGSEYQRTPEAAIRKQARVALNEDTVESIQDITREEIELEVRTSVHDLEDFIDAEVTDVNILEGIATRLIREKNRQQDEQGSKEDVIRQILTALSEPELSQDVLSLPRKELMGLVHDKLLALVGKPTGEPKNESEQTQWRKLASDERQKARAIDTQLATKPGTAEQTQELENKRREHVKNSQLYDKVADLCDLRADEIRLQVGLKPESERVLKILRNNTEADPRTKFQRLAKWLTKNKYVRATGIVVGIIGGLAAMSAFLYDVLKKSAHGVKDFGNATYQTVKDTANYVSEKGETIYTALVAVGSAVYKVLSLLSGLIQTMAYYMWFVIIALAYFVYTKILGK